ncbi:MAG TPA: 2-dehydropantoate 2-reductase [Vicinamibacterales bacterium]
MHIAVFGSGAVGGYYGARLARAGHRVTFIARGAHLQAIRERGLLVWSPLGDFLVRAEADSEPERVGPVDLVLLAVKTYHNPEVLPRVPALCGPATSVLTLQNGVDSVDELAAAVGEARVIAGTTYIATAIAAPGVIEQTGFHRRVILGEAFGDRTRISERVAHIAEVLRDADVQAEAVPDGRVPVWEKLIYLAPFAAFTGAARRPAGAIWHDEVSRAAFLAVVQEVEAVARAEGVPVAGDMQQRVTDYMNALPPSTRSSLLIDLQQGKRTEVEALQGAVVRRGQARNVPTPGMQALHAVLRAASQAGRA